ncbi:hypothetical protein R3P38DRAFT_2761887 [Favolaschia claudopus]|uniref:Uncharacterized protein n=1 Tax=Favolaschia claudopus TaxID=2862362 RepID=A0AAW0DNS1_9AGAR
MSVLSPLWPSQTPWNGHSSFSALAAPVVPPLDPLDLPFPSTSHGFNALGSSPSPHPQMSRQQSPAPAPSAFAIVPPRNDRSLDRKTLISILDFFSTLIPARLGHHQVRLVIHGGAVMLLNAELAQLAAVTAASDGRAKQRSTTRDIDYIARSFSSEWAQRYGMFDANERLKQCIHDTAVQYGLGADWMNSDADVALPMATDPVTGAAYDPIHAASIQVGDSLAVYTSPNGLLKLVSVTPFWTVALKMVRYNAADREDICILLRSGTLSRQFHWTPTRLELWLLGTCWAMGYSNYDPERIKVMRQRMIEVVAEANRWDPDAVADDGRGGVVPLRPTSAMGMYAGAAYGYDYSYMPMRSPIYNYTGFVDPRMTSPFHSPVPSPRSHAFPQSRSPAPFIPLMPIIAPDHKTTNTALTAWPSQWTHLGADSRKPRREWDPERAEQWDQEVQQTAAKEKKHSRMTSWIPFLKGSKSQPALKSSNKPNHTRSPQRRKTYYEDDDSSSSDDSDSDDEDWRQVEQLKWAHRRTMSGARGASTGIQHSVADFMSNGMTPIAAPAVMASGPVAGQQHVLPGWQVPAPPPPQSPPPASSPPPPWAYPYMYPYAGPYPYPYQQMRSPPPPLPYPPDMHQVTAGINSLGLYA